jgi:hypothetical protein
MWWLTPVGRIVGRTADILDKLYPSRSWKWLQAISQVVVNIFWNLAMSASGQPV